MGVILNVGLMVAFATEKKEIRTSQRQKFQTKLKTLVEKAKSLGVANTNGRKALLQELNMFIEDMQNQSPQWLEQPVPYSDFGTALLLIWSILEVPANN